MEVNRVSALISVTGVLKEGMEGMGTLDPFCAIIRVPMKPACLQIAPNVIGKTVLASNKERESIAKVLDRMVSGIVNKESTAIL
jgi:hypothetical protein